MGCRKMTVYPIAAFASAALWVAAVSTTAAQERAATPAAQQHAHSGSRAPAAATDKEADFLAANDAAMKNMMADMTVAPTGDIDRDFVAMMVPHHQGAIDMAQSVLRYGRNQQIRRLAQEIIVTQQQEIAAPLQRNASIGRCCPQQQCCRGIVGVDEEAGGATENISHAGR